MPHRKAGRVCGCGYVFTPKSMTLTISKPKEERISPNIDEKVLVCFSCFNKHYEENE